MAFSKYGTGKIKGEVKTKSLSSSKTSKKNKAKKEEVLSKEPEKDQNVETKKEPKEKMVYEKPVLNKVFTPSPVTESFSERNPIKTGTDPIQVQKPVTPSEKSDGEPV